MPTTRKKTIKTVYKDEESEGETGDFSDSGSDAKISKASSSEDEDFDVVASSEDELNNKTKKKGKSVPVRRKTKFAKEFIAKINKQALGNEDVTPDSFTVKDLTDEDKLLPSVLNLSESDSSDDECPKNFERKQPPTHTAVQVKDTQSDNEETSEYRDVWSFNTTENSEEIAKKTFTELEKHKTKIEETKATLQNYSVRETQNKLDNFNVNDLLAQGEEVSPQKSPPIKKKTKARRKKDDSDSDMEDWEEVKESKSIPQQGLQLIVELPNTVSRKTKTIDVEMMMKRKINRVKKEYQVYMHKVHVLCWLGHGNYVSKVLNDQEIMAAALAMVPKGCYPEDRLNIKYVEDITKWYKEKIIIKQDKNEHKFRPKAPPLKALLLDQMKKRAVTAKKYAVFIFVSMLRALGLQCRVMFNFVTLSIKPPSSELCSLSTKPKEDKTVTKKVNESNENKDKPKTKNKSKAKSIKKIAQVDGNYDISSDSEINMNIMQVDGNNDSGDVKSRRSARTKRNEPTANSNKDEGVSPPKRSKTGPTKESAKVIKEEQTKPAQRKMVTRHKSETQVIPVEKKNTVLSKSPQGKQINTEQIEPLKVKSSKPLSLKKSKSNNELKSADTEQENVANARLTRSTRNAPVNNISTSKKPVPKKLPPKILINDVTEPVESNFFSSGKEAETKPTRKRSRTAIVKGYLSPNSHEPKAKTRTKSAPGNVEKSKYFERSNGAKKSKLNTDTIKDEDKKRVSHRDLIKQRVKPSNDVTEDLICIVKNRIKEDKAEAKKGIVKGKLKVESEEDSDYLLEEDLQSCKSGSSDDFKPVKISPKPKLSKASTSKTIDRRVLSSEEESVKSNKCDVWCEIYVEELEQWISVDVVKGKVHCTESIYTNCTHPVCYIVGWDNNNYLKDLTRRYVPHWNTVTRKLRAEPDWWKVAIQPWLGPKTAKDKEEDEQLDRMQLEAPLPKSIAEYKNHPLYALKRHLLKFEALYPPDAATLGFVRGEAVYSRDCVYTCRSRDIWLKEAKVVKMGEKPYKIVKARPKWDRLSNKLITDKPLEIFGPWQTQDYEPPTAENGIVPRNAYGNVELFKECMLPKGTAHIKLPGLNKVAKKLNIDCAPAMTGFDFNGGWSHPVYDGFVVCKEFEEIITEAWVKDQEEQERREIEKIETRVYGNWRRLIKGLLIKERLKLKYGFEEPTTSQNKKDKPKQPRLVVKKK